MREWFTVISGKSLRSGAEAFRSFVVNEGQRSCVTFSGTFQKSFCAHDDRKVDHRAVQGRPRSPNSVLASSKAATSAGRRPAQVRWAEYCR